MKTETDLIQRTLMLWMDTFQANGIPQPSERLEKLQSFLESTPTNQTDQTPEPSVDDSEVFTHLDELIKKIPEPKA